MAIYHLSVKPVSRSSGRSATASAAYRAAERIEDRRTGETHDYARKGGVESADIVLPDHAPTWASNRAALWNAAEFAEKRKVACVAREYEVALPSELPPEERRRLAVDFARDMANREGCAVDVCIHTPGRGGDERNHHAHLLRTTRKIEAKGLGEKLDTEKAGRNRKQDLESVRERWAELVNDRLQENGIESQIDHRSLEVQGIDRQPTQHLGPAVSGLMRRGADSEVVWRMAEETNARLFAAREMGLIERDIDRSIIDLSGDLAGAIRERQERDRRPSAKDIEKGLSDTRLAYEQHKAERTGPAVQSSRFIARKQTQTSFQETIHRAIWGELTKEEIRQSVPEESKPKPKTIRQAAAERVMPSRPDFESMPIERQAHAVDAMRNAMAQARKAKLDRVAQKATARCDRRAKLARKVWQASPTPPTGLLASFKRQGYETALGQWQKDRMKAEKLHDQAEKTRGKIAYKTLYDSSQQNFAKWRLERMEPDLMRRVEAYRAAERAKHEEQCRKECASKELEREFKGMAARRAMKAHGYTDRSPQWQGTPLPLREIIDLYNSHTKDKQERALAAWMRDPEKSRSIATMIEKRLEHTQDRGHGR